MANAYVSHNYLEIAGLNTSLYDDCIKVLFSQMEFLPWNNPDNIVSYTVEKDVHTIRNYVLYCFALIGVPANVINMIVFFKQSLKDRVNLCLFSLSLADEMFLVMSVLTNIETTFSDQFVMSMWLANNNVVALLGSFFVSLVLSAIIACERCFCVLSPLKYQTLLPTRTMAFIVITVFLVNISLFYIVSFRYHVGCIYEPVLGIMMRTMVTNSFYRKHQQFVNTLDSVVLGAGLVGFATIVVVTATIITAFKLRQVVTWRAKTSSSLSPREVALTKMLIGSSVLFIICTFPSCLFRVVCLFFPEMTAGGRTQNLYFSCLWITEGLGHMNSSFNVFIYYKLGSRYRETLSTLFCRKAKAEKGKM